MSVALPDIHFAETDSAVIERQLLTAYERIAGVTLYPGDPVRLLLESLAYILAVQNGVIDAAGRQGLLAYASGGHLDHLGALLGVVRLAARPSRCMVTFSLAAALGYAVTVPSGTRVATRDGKAVFAASASGTIAAGGTSVSILCEAETAGAAANGLVAGQINTLVDPVAYIASVANSSTSTDGDDAESDAHLRERIRLAPEALSVAGPRGAYEALALAASTAIGAVSVTSPTPGTVDVRVVMADGSLPDAATLALVTAALSAGDVRPLTDSVSVAAPTTVAYNITLTWYLSADDAALQTTITTAVAAAVDSYALWQKIRPGRDINPSELVRRVMDAGARRVVLTSPAYTTVASTAVAAEGTVTVTYGGTETE